VAVTIAVTYPDGSGATTTATTNPGAGGAFSFAGIPVGNHTILAVYRATDDTVVALASSLPRTGAFVSLRLPDAPFGASSTGPGSPSIVYVSGTAQATGASGDSVQFDIRNETGSSITITSLTATYSHTPAAYFERIVWDGTLVFNETNPRAGSGDNCGFTAGQPIGAGATLTVKLQRFKNTATGGGAAQDMSNTTFTVTLSDGSSMSFTTPL
jgi:hypothetical protein